MVFLPWRWDIEGGGGGSAGGGCAMGLAHAHPRVASGLILMSPLRLAVEESECGLGQTSLMILNSWVTLGKLLMLYLLKIHAHPEPEIVALC